MLVPTENEFPTLADFELIVVGQLIFLARKLFEFLAFNIDGLLFPED